MSDSDSRYRRDVFFRWIVMRWYIFLAAALALDVFFRPHVNTRAPQRVIMRSDSREILSTEVGLGDQQECSRDKCYIAPKKARPTAHSAAEHVHKNDVGVEIEFPTLGRGQETSQMVVPHELLLGTLSHGDDAPEEA